MNALWNAVRAHAAQDRVLSGLRWGTVTSVDPVLYRIKVELQPEGVVTAWLPILSHAAGQGWSMLMLPDIGMQAALIADSGHGGNLVVVGFSHSTTDTPPSVPAAIGAGGTPNATAAPNVAGELIVRSKSGAVFRLCANGDIYLRPASGTVGIDGTLKVNGGILATEGITAGFGGPDSVTLQFHTHPQGADSHGDAEVPTSAPTPGT